MLTTNLHNVRPLRAIGGRRGMTSLESFAEDNGLALFPTIQANTMRTMPGRFTRGVNRSMLTRNITNNIEAIFHQQMHTRSNSAFFVMLSPNYWANYAARINRNFTNMGFSNVAATDIGNTLFGNYGRGRVISRYDALDYAEAALSALNNDLGLMLTNPNVYAFAHANAITDMPFRPGGRRIVDFNIPFVQMVLGNYIPHSMPAYNIEPMAWRGFAEYLLRAVESRSGMKLQLTYQNERAFYPTFQQFWFSLLPNMFFQTEFEQHWQHRIGHYYAQFNTFWQAVRGADVTSHTVYARGQHVRMTYDNGVVVYINYSNDWWNINGRSIAPLSFQLAGV